MGINLSTKKSKVIILGILFFVFVATGGYLFWRINQPEELAPGYTEANNTPGCTIVGDCYLVVGECVGNCAGGGWDYCGTCGISPDPDNCGERVPSSSGKAVGTRCDGKEPYTYECGVWCYLPSNGPNCCSSPPTPTRYTVEYNGNGGVCEPSSRTVDSGKNASAPSCSRTGYTLTSFDRESGSGGTLNITTGAVTNVTGDQKIRANWSINKYTVTYSPGDGATCDPSSREVEHGGTSSGPDCGKENHIIVSFTRTSGSGGELDPETGTVTDVTGTQTITVNWEELPDSGCGDKAGTYSHTLTDWPQENTEWCEIGEPSNFQPDQKFPSPGGRVEWLCTSGTHTAECYATTEDFPEEREEDEEDREITTVPETGIFDDSQTAVLVGLSLLILGFTWRIIGRGMYMSVSFLGRIPRRISIHLKDVKEDMHMRKRVRSMKKRKQNREKFEKKVRKGI